MSYTTSSQKTWPAGGTIIESSSAMRLGKERWGVIHYIKQRYERVPHRNRIPNISQIKFEASKVKTTSTYPKTQWARKLARHELDHQPAAFPSPSRWVHRGCRYRATESESPIRVHHSISTPDRTSTTILRTVGTIQAYTPSHFQVGSVAVAWPKPHFKICSVSKESACLHARPWGTYQVFRFAVLYESDGRRQIRPLGRLSR